MAAAKDKYAGLPDLDQGPDLFDTPSLTDDNASTTAPTSLSTDNDDAVLNDYIDRQKLDRQAASARFAGSRVDASQADFSDRINRERRSYQVKSRRVKGRRRRGTVTGEEGTEGGVRLTGEDEDADEREEEVEDWSDEDEELSGEVLRRRLARLNREAAVLKSAVERRREEGEEVALDGFEELQGTIGALSRAIMKGERSAEERLRQKLSSNRGVQPGPNDDAANQTSAGTDGRAYTISYAPTYNSSHALAKAASFDTRLTLLETLLGADNTTLPTGQNQAFRKPLLPTMDILDKKLAVLTTTSAASLDGVQTRVQVLLRDTERLKEARVVAKEAQDALSSPRANRLDDERGSTGGNSELGLEDPEQVAKINALHGTLPTIEALAPILPGLLDRLRSLRLLHTDAGNASSSLSELEKRQAETDTEIAEWRESLDKVEAMLGRTEDNTQQNAKVIEGWVKDITRRMEALGK